MSAISVELKKATELEKTTTPSNDNLLLIHDGTGLKAITYQNLAKQVNAPIENKIAFLLFDGAGAHNAIYRGKKLGESVTSEQYTAISSGKFTDLYIGDYWTIESVNWRIAAFDYYYGCGDTAFNTHHAVIVPDTCLYLNKAKDNLEETKRQLEIAKENLKEPFSR